MNDIKDLTLILKSRFPIVVIETHEEPRAQALLERISNLEEWPLWTWSVAQGLKRFLVSDAAMYETKELNMALRNIAATPSMGIYVFMDAHPFLADPVNQRLVKEIAQDYNKVARTLVFVGPRAELSGDLKRMSASFSMSLPGTEGIRKIIQEEMQLYEQSNAGQKVKGQQETAQLLVQHLAGMCADDVRRLARQAIRDDGMITMEDVRRILRHKHETQDSSGVLSLELDAGNFSEVGGMPNLKRWLELRRNAFNKPDGKLDPPKGILLLGVQGAGKSMACKAVAAAWGLPLLRMDFGALYNKYHGETERNLRESLKAAESMAPCVLWMDEIEKGLAPDEGSGDGGVSRRVLGTLLTWMTERRARIFMAATANDISQLPPELLRKGRFDEIFFVDLPDTAVREDIFRIHLQRRGHAATQFDLAALASRTEGFSGAEIEQAIVSGLYEAGARNEPLSQAHIESEIQRTRPLSVVMAEKIEDLRQWAEGRTVVA
jgi:SpoVK/Ycf46/Vps4 family AAA+-type ATPase